MAVPLRQPKTEKRGKSTMTKARRALWRVSPLSCWGERARESSASLCTLNNGGQVLSTELSDCIKHTHSFIKPRVLRTKCPHYQGSCCYAIADVTVRFEMAAQRRGTAVERRVGAARASAIAACVRSRDGVPAKSAPANSWPRTHARNRNSDQRFFFSRDGVPAKSALACRPTGSRSPGRSSPGPLAKLDPAGP